MTVITPPLYGESKKKWWQWPEKPYRMTYKQESITKQNVQPPIPLNNRGIYSFDEADLVKLWGVQLFNSLAIHNSSLSTHQYQFIYRFIYYLFNHYSVVSLHIILTNTLKNIHNVHQSKLQNIKCPVSFRQMSR